MKRRSFLGSLTAMASMFCMNVGFSSGSRMTGVQKNGFFEVNGSPEDCQAFAEAFQTNLWPEWRTHSNDIARRIMRQCESLHRTGCARVSSHGKQLEEALGKTLNQFACKMSFPSNLAALVIAFALLIPGTASAQCVNGTCNLLPKVAETVQRILPVVHNDFAYAAPAATEASQDCGCQGQCGKPGCTCAPVEVAAPVETFAAVPMQTPVRTILRAPLRARPLQRLFRCR